MAKATLKPLFHPESLALFGASPDSAKMGWSVMKNLLAGGFGGPILPVNPKYSSVQGVLCYRNASSLPLPPEMALICTPPVTVPGILRDLEAKGCKTAVVLTADPEGGGPRTKLKASIEGVLGKGMRVVGPGSVGILIPGSGLNGTWSNACVTPGRVALISQSGAVAQSVMHWGQNHGVGFSHVISTGDSSDVDIGEIIDHLALEPSARAILLYLQHLSGARRFLSAARAAARIKPVIVIRSGSRFRDGSAMAAGGQPSVPVDLIFDAAFRRVGLLRVPDLDELLAAVENLAHGKPLLGERLMIVSNGAGTAETAADAHASGGGVLASISGDLMAELKPVLPERAAVDNPLDIGRDAGPDRYGRVLDALTRADGIDAILVMHTPTSVSDEGKVAQAVADATRRSQRNVISCWLGGDVSGVAHDVCQDAGIPVFTSPDKAAEAFLYMVRYRKIQDLLMETPPPPPGETADRLSKARGIIGETDIGEYTVLDEERSARLLTAYGINCEEARLARSDEELIAGVREMGFPLALKLASPDLLRGQELGGMVLGITSEEALSEAAAMLRKNYGENGECQGRPFPGYVLQKRVWKSSAEICSASVSTDAVFGPVISMAGGGAARFSTPEVSVGLPPFNMKIAEELAGRLKFLSLNAEDPSRLAETRNALSVFLVRVSQMVEDLPEITAMEINPLLAGADGVLAADARFALTSGGRMDFAIRPYPRELEETATLKDKESILIRPVRPEDEDAYRVFLSRMSDDDIRKRFFSFSTNFPKAQIVSMTALDFEREMAFVAMGGAGEIMGIVHIQQSIDNKEAEYAITIRSDLKTRGLGRALMEKIIGYARDRGIGCITGLVLRENLGMLALCLKLGFSFSPDPDPEIMSVRLNLNR